MTKEQIVDIIPQPNEFPSSIKTSLGSTMSSLTKEEPFKKKNNKVETFLKNWKNKRNKKTNSNNTFNKQNICKERITYCSESSNSSISSSSISEFRDNNIPSNKPSLKSPVAKLTNDSNSKSSSIPSHSTNVRQSNIKALQRKPKLDINNPLHKVHKCRQGKLTTKNKSLHDFGFQFESKTKVINTNNKSIKYSQDYLPNKLNLPNEPKGDPMITKPPSSIRIFYMNIHGTNKTSDEHSLL